MEEKYGKKLHKLGTLPMVYMPEVFLVVVLIIAFGAFLATNINGGGPVITAPVVISFILLILALAVTIRLITNCRVEIYENAIGVFTMKGGTFYTVDQITAIIWTFPGANAVNSRAARTNNTIAELIIKGQHKSVKLSDAYYKNLEKPLTAFQTSHKIPNVL